MYISLERFAQAVQSKPLPRMASELIPLPHASLVLETDTLYPSLTPP